MKRIALTQGQFAFVDDRDFKRVNRFKWFAAKCSGRWYAGRKIRTNGGRKNLYLHRYILGEPKSAIDHIDGNGLNNTRKNLRLCSGQQNNWNKGIQRNNTSGFKGVSRGKSKSKPWIATISRERKIYYLGSFATREDAARAYDKAVAVERGEFARTNFR